MNGWAMEYCFAFDMDMWQRQTHSEGFPSYYCGAGTVLVCIININTIYMNVFIGYYTEACYI